MGKQDVQPTKCFSTKTSILHRDREKDQIWRTTLRNWYAFFSHLDYHKLTIKRYQETAPEMIQRSFSQQSDLNKVERPFLYYIPSTQQSAPSKPQPKGNPRSILSYLIEKLMSIFSTPYLPANTLRTRTYHVSA